MTIDLFKAFATVVGITGISTLAVVGWRSSQVIFRNDGLGAASQVGCGYAVLALCIVFAIVTAWREF